MMRGGGPDTVVGGRVCAIANFSIPTFGVKLFVAECLPSGPLIIRPDIVGGVLWEHSTRWTRCLVPLRLYDSRLRPL